MFSQRLMRRMRNVKALARETGGIWHEYMSQSQGISCLHELIDTGSGIGSNREHRGQQNVTAKQLYL